MKCPNCTKDIAFEEAAFCPYCGKELLETGCTEMSDELKKWINKIQSESDPLKKHSSIETALKCYPDSLPLHEEALFLGRLYLRDGKHIDYSLIKCYLLHMYLTPEAFTDKHKDEMRNELFHDAELEICLSLCGDTSNFLKRYFRKLSKQFTNLFLCGSTYYTRTFFGFRMDRKLERVLAEPAAEIIRNILEDDKLSEKERSILAESFLLGFADEVGDAAYLKEKLEKDSIIIGTTEC